MGAPTGPPDVDDVRVGRPHVLDLDTQLLADRREVAGHEDVGRRDDPRQYPAALLVGEIGSEAALAAIRYLQEGVGAVLGQIEQVAQGPLRVTVGGLDLDEIGQRGTGRRDERPVRHLNDSDTFQWTRHARVPPLGPSPRTTVLEANDRPRSTRPSSNQ